MRCFIAALAIIISTVASAAPQTRTGQAAQRFIKSFDRIAVILPRETKNLMSIPEWELKYPASECDARTEPNPAQSDSTRVFIMCPEFSDTSELSFVFVTDPTRDKKALYLKEVLNNGETLNRDEFENFAERPDRSYGNFQTILSRWDVLLTIGLGNGIFAKYGDLQMFQGRMVEDMGYICLVAAQKVNESKMVLRCQSEDPDQIAKGSKPTFALGIDMDAKQLWEINLARVGDRVLTGRDLMTFLKPMRPRQQSNR